MPTPDSSTDGGADGADDGVSRRARRSRRVTWTPPGNPGDGVDTVPDSEAPHASGEPDAAQDERTNDQRLTADKPPHWG